MNRRGFLGLFGAAAVAPLVPVPELLLPTKTIFLPPRGGWATNEQLVISLDDFVRKYIRPAMAELARQIDSDCLSLVNNARLTETHLEFTHAMISNDDRPRVITLPHRVIQ